MPQNVFMEQSQTEVPDLLSLIWESFELYLAEQLDLRRQAGRTIKYASGAEAAAAAPASSFRNYAQRYLQENPPVEAFADVGWGFRLANNQLCVISSQDGEDRGMTTAADSVEIAAPRTRPTVGRRRNPNPPGTTGHEVSI